MTEIEKERSAPMQFRKRPVVIDAVQWFKPGDHPAVVLKSDPNRPADEGIPWVPTLEGGHIVTPGDWIITGVKGEHYPCKPDVFAMTYEQASRASSVAPAGGVHPNHLADLRYAMDALKLAREAIEPLTEAQIKLHRIKRDTHERIEAAIVGMRYIIKRTEEALVVLGAPQEAEQQESVHPAASPCEKIPQVQGSEGASSAPRDGGSAQ